MDAIAGPLDQTTQCMARIARGDIPPRITDSYNGDFNEIKNNLNLSASTPLNYARGPDAMSAVQGRPWRASCPRGPTRTRHQGDFRKMRAGLSNDTLDAVIGPLNVAAGLCGPDLQGGHPPQDHGQTTNGDFNEIKNNLNACVDRHQGLVESNRILKGIAINDRRNKHGRQLQRQPRGDREGDQRSAGAPLPACRTSRARSASWT